VLTNELQLPARQQHVSTHTTREGTGRSTHMPQCLLQRRLTEVCMHHENRHRVSVGMCEGHTHDNEAGNVTPTSEVILL
jgi:hypothetical protein